MGALDRFLIIPRRGQPVVDEPELDDEVLRFSDAGPAGVALDIETLILRESGPQAHDEHLRAHREYERSVEEMLREPPDS